MDVPFLFEDFIFQQFEDEMSDRKFCGKADKECVFDVWKGQLSVLEWVELGEMAIQKAVKLCQK